MAQNITDYPNFFRQAKEAITLMDMLTKKEKDLTYRYDNAVFDVESEKKAMQDKIALTIKERTEEINKTYDKEIAAGNAKLKKSKSDREKVKNQGIKERIIEETSELRSTNRNLKNNLSELFKKNKVPAICKTRFYYSLYFPHSIVDILKLILAFIICFIVIPCGIYFLFTDHTKTWILVIIYAIDAIVFGSIYIIIGNATRTKHFDILREGMKIQDEIKHNNSAIESIKKKILRDNDESSYNLGAYDDDIAHIQQELADITMKKREALNTFETVTKNIIADEITANAASRLSSLEDIARNTKSELDDISAKRKEKALEISSNYEVHLGKDFMTADRIDALSSIMAHGTASNISEAIDEYNRRIDE